jgi:cell volume regulation protein A
MNSLETILLSISILIIISTIVAKVSKKIGMPVLLIFIGIGMLAGSEGPGGIEFDNASIAQNVGIISLIFILFSGGLDTNWSKTKPVLWSSLSLSTLGVLITTFAVGAFVHFLFYMEWPQALLLGAVVSSTDAAAVFSILSLSNLNLKGKVKPLLEVESGTNDPMAIFLTISLIVYITNQSTSYLEFFESFILEMGLGFLIGFSAGRLMVAILNNIRFPIEGFYTVFALAFSVLIYSFTAKTEGSGFLAVYVAGVVVNKYEVVHKRAIYRFFDGLAWLCQAGMFITLGLLVFPSKLVPVVFTGILVSVFLIVVARPLGVFISLAKSDFDYREKLLISWVGLRGAVPVILATFPLLAGIEEAGWIFNVVFFIVLSSAIVQGWSISPIAKWLKLDAPLKTKIKSPVEFSYPPDSTMKLINLRVPESHTSINKSLVQIPQLKGNLIVTITRDNNYFVPSGGTVLESGDIIQVLVAKENVRELKEYFS